MATYKHITADEARQMAQMYENGMTMEEVGRAFDVTASTVNHWLKKMGTPTRKGGWGSRTGTPRPPKTQPEPEETYEAALCLQNKSIELHGMIGAYVIDCKAQEVLATITKEGAEAESLLMSFEALDAYIDKAQTFIKELQAIKRKTVELKVENVMW